MMYQYRVIQMGKHLFVFARVDEVEPWKQMWGTNSSVLAWKQAESLLDDGKAHAVTQILESMSELYSLS